MLLMFPEDQDPLEDEKLMEFADQALEKKLRERREQLASMQNEARSNTQDTLSDTQLEKFKTLSCREIFLDSEHPELSPVLSQYESLHNKALVPEDILTFFMKGDYAAFRDGMRRGGLFDRFEPYPDERADYQSQNSNYLSVREHLINDLTGASNKPGDYHLMGMFDETDNLRGYFSFRMLSPNATQEEVARYVAFMDHELMTNKSDIEKTGMHYREHWNIERMRKDFPHMMLIDTIVVEQGWGKGGTYVLLRDTLQKIKDTYGSLPKSMVCYRFEGFPVIGEEDGQLRLIGPNIASQDLFMRVGFTPMAYRSTPGECIVRRLGDEPEVCIMKQPTWLYLYSSSNDLCVELKKRLVQENLLSPEQPLLS